MPISGYFNGQGDKIMAELVKRYGPVKGKQFFYAIAKKNHQEPKTASRGNMTVPPAQQSPAMRAMMMKKKAHGR